MDRDSVKEAVVEIASKDGYVYVLVEVDARSSAEDAFDVALAGRDAQDVATDHWWQNDRDFSDMKKKAS